MVARERPTIGQRIDGALRGMRYGTKATWGWGGYGYLGGGTGYSTTAGYQPSIDYATETGDPSGNSAVMACIQWVMRAFPQSRPVVRVYTDDDDPDELIRNHAMVQTLRRPNAFYSGTQLWQAVCFSYNLTGNGYIRKIRSMNDRTGPVIQLWWEPHYTIRPVGGTTLDDFITHYELYRNGHWLSDASDRVPVENIIHFRFGQDPLNPRLGLSQLGAAIKEIYTDEQAAGYAAMMLRNSGVPPLIVSPTDQNDSMSLEEAQGIKLDLIAKTTGARRGEPLVLPAGVKVDMLAFNPEQMNLREVRDIPVERVSSLLGVSRWLAGLGRDPKFSNYKEAREAGYEDNILPTAQIFAETLTTTLLPDFTQDEDEYADWDHTHVRAMQEDQTAKKQRIQVGYDGGWLTLNEARKADDMTPLEGGDVLKVPSMIVLTPIADLAEPPEPVQPVVEATSTNGNGHSGESIEDMVDVLAGDAG